MKNIKLMVCLLVAGLVAGCGSDDGGGPGTVDKTGPWFGYVFDAKSGEPLNFFGEGNGTFDQNSPDQIYALIEGAVRLARPCPQGEINEANGLSRAGCFMIENLPQDVDIPVYVKRAGYHPFNSEVDLPGEVSGHLYVNDPSEYNYVRLFPTGTNYDVTVTVAHSADNDRALAGITVRCIYDSQGAFDVLGTNSSQFLSPYNTFSPVITGTSDENGKVTLLGAELTKGGSYDCFAHGTDLVDGCVIAGSSESSSGSSLSFTVGVDEANQRLPVQCNGEGSDYEDEIAVAVNYSTSTPLGGLGETMQIYLTRPVDLVPGTENCQYVSAFSFAPGPDDLFIETEPDVDNEAAESAAVSVSADGFTVSIQGILAADSSTDDIAPVFEFGGIYLRPRTPPGNGIVLVAGGNSLSGFLVESSFGTGATCGAIDSAAIDLEFTNGGGDVPNASLMQN
jgi:hypothetical protein